MPGKSSGGERERKARTGSGPTAQRVLDVSERLVQQRGFNAFSYADVAGELGISKASVHHHFATKTKLGEALIARYAGRFNGALQAIAAETPDAPRQLEAYARLYAEVLRDGRMCLCGMLAAEYEGLPRAIGQAIVVFFDENEAWLAGVLERGRGAQTLSFPGSSEGMARLLISTLEGALLVARPYHEVDRFQATAALLLRDLVGMRPHAVGEVQVAERSA